MQRVRHRRLPCAVVAPGGDSRPDAARSRDVAGDVLEVDDASAQQAQRGVDRGRECADLLREPDVVPAEQLGHHALDYAQNRAARRDRDHRIDDDEILRALERGVEVVAHLGRREPIE